MVVREPAAPQEPDDEVDVTLIRWMLTLSLEERLAVLQGFADSVAELESPQIRAAVVSGADRAQRRC